jgi:two-component system chemotaxis response regulator CheY/two-component system cell cycle response regulator DivK
MPTPEIPVIAIVDDDPIYRKILSMLLKKSNMTILFEAENGADCIRLMQESTVFPDLVILDVEMPVMDGFETAKLLKLSWPEVRLIGHSSAIDINAQAEMMACGVNVFLVKDAQSKKIVETIRQILNEN